MKQILEACKLKQPQLVEKTGISLDRVKNLSSGRVQGFTKEEAQALVEKLYVSSHWLAVGEGEVLQSPQEREFYRRLSSLRAATTGSNVEGLSDKQKTTFQQILFAYESGITDSLQDLLADVLAADERVLLERYRGSPQAVKDAALRVVMIGSDATVSTVQHISGNQGQVAGSHIYNETGAGNGKKKGKTKD